MRRPLGKVIKETFCINQACSFHNKAGSIVIWKNKGAHTGELYHCRECGKNFSTRYGTFFKGKKVKPEKIVAVLRALIEGQTIRGCARLFGLSKDTIIRWLISAGQQCQAVEKTLINDFGFNHVELNKLWTFIETKTTHPVNREEKNKKINY